MDADLSSSRRSIIGAGFAGAKAQPSLQLRAAAADDPSAPVPVAVEIAVREGARTIVGTVQVTGNQSVADATLRPAIGLQPGQPYFDAQLAVDGDAMQQRYANLGYQNATDRRESRASTPT